MISSSVTYASIVCQYFIFFVFKQKTAYEMRISDWSSDVCSSDLHRDHMTTALHLQAIAAIGISVRQHLVGLQRRAAVIDVGTVASEHRDQNRNQNQDRQLFFHRAIPPTHAGKATRIALFRNPRPRPRRAHRRPHALVLEYPRHHQPSLPLPPHP